MKKILYSLLALTFVLAGCEKFEEYTSEKYPAGPTVTVEATEVTDSTFNLKVTPAAGTYFYSYVVEKANQPTEFPPLAFLPPPRLNIHRRAQRYRAQAYR